MTQNLLAVTAVVAGVAVFAGAATYVAKTFVSGAVTSPEALTGQTDCSLMSARSASKVMGQPMTAVQFGPMGAIGVTALDSRLLPRTALACWVLSAESAASGSGQGSEAAPTLDTARAARVAAVSGDDASQTFAAGRSQAQAGGFLGAEVTDLGDEAFCTLPDASGAAGVMARSKTSVVYVSTTPVDASGASARAAEASAAGTCAVAARLARLALDH